MTDTQQQEFKATPEQWAALEIEKSRGGMWEAALLELRSRVEALEKQVQELWNEENENLTVLERRVYELEEINRLKSPSSVPTAAAETTEPSSADASTWTWVTTKVFYENGAMMRTQVRVT